MSGFKCMIFLGVGFLNMSDLRSIRSESEAWGSPQQKQLVSSFSLESLFVPGGDSGKIFIYITPPHGLTVWLLSIYIDFAAGK